LTASASLLLGRYRAVGYSTSMGIQVKVAGDPRRPQEAVDYTPPRAAQDEEAFGDLIFIAAILLGVSGIFLKVKIAAWAGIVLCLSGVANMSTTRADTKNMTMAIAFCFFGLIGSYMTPPVPKGPVKTATT